MATVTFTSAKGESVIFAGSPIEMADPVGSYGFAFTNNDDWYTAGDSKTDIDERPVADGAFGILRDWRPGLPISIIGWYRGPDRAAVRAARRRLQLVVANGKNVDIEFADEDEVTSRGLSIRSMVPGNLSGLYFPIEIDAIALDPTAYGAEQVFTTGIPTPGGGLLFPLGSSGGGTDTYGYGLGGYGEGPYGGGDGSGEPGSGPYWDFGPDGTSGRVSVTNHGNTETYPMLQVTGGLGGGFIITDVTTGDVVSIARNIPLGSTVTINQRSGSVTIDGQSDISGSLTSYGFFSVGPGETHLIQFSPIGAITGAPQLTVTMRDGNL